MPAKPLHFSKTPKKALQHGTRFGDEGAEWMGYEPMKCQREIWSLLEAKTSRGLPLYEQAAVEIPRRAGKTEALLAELVGRCALIDGYSALYTAQSGTKSRERFYGLLRRLRAGGKKGWRARESRGEERIEFDNGSILRFMPPIAASFRGDALDMWVCDEAQEIDEEDSADLIGSALPTFDTRPGAQLVIAGTAGEMRSGLLWEALESGRKGAWGVIEYAAPDGMDLDDPKNWLKVHPGPAGIPAADALAVLKKRFESMTEEMFRREYLGVWPDVASRRAFSDEVWGALGRAFMDRPARVAFAFDVVPSGSHASVVAVWRDSAGFSYVEVVEDKAGTDWVAPLLVRLASQGRVPVGHDTSGTETLRVADEIARLSRQRVNLVGLSTIEFATACSAFSQEVLTGKLRHFRQAPLNDAIGNAVHRKIRDGGWAWGRVASSGSIAPLIAATVAVKVCDDMPPARELRVLTAAR